MGTTCTAFRLRITLIMIRTNIGPAQNMQRLAEYSVVVRSDGIASPCIPVPTFVTSPGSITADMSCPPAVPMHLCNSGRTVPVPWDCFQGGGAI